jgi:hypothetical protein
MLVYLQRNFLQATFRSFEPSSEKRIEKWILLRTIKIRKYVEHFIISFYTYKSKKL